MSYSTDAVIYSSDRYQVTSYGNGAAYELRSLTDIESTVFLQGGDATEFRSTFDAFDALDDDGRENLTEPMDAWISQFFGRD